MKSHIRNLYLLILCLVAIFFSGNAQDMQFSQFYANSLYMNPAFAGSAHGLRLISHQRLQWPKLDAKYITMVFSADNYFRKTKSGVGVIFLRDIQGSNAVSSTDFAMQYAQEVNLNSKFSLRMGAQGSYVSRYINYSRLTFPDQFNDDGFSNNQTGEDNNTNKVNYLDFSGGGFLYSDNFWLGASVNHINTPNQAFTGGESNLPAKWSFVTGYKINFEDKNNKSLVHADKEMSITPTIHYRMQGKSDQADLGLYGIYHRLLIGFWYRGIPVKHYREGLQNNESLVIIGGCKIHNVSFAYSYDFTVSKLVTARTGGAHEINITYIHANPPKKKKKGKPMPCPHFYK